MLPTSEGQHTGHDPSANNGNEVVNGGEYHKLNRDGEPLIYFIEPGTPKSRLPLEEATKTLQGIGYQNFEVMAEISLAPDKESGSDYTVWLVKDRGTHQYAVVNGDKARELSEAGIDEVTDYDFVMNFAEVIKPGSELVIGRGAKTLGFENASKARDRDGNIGTLSSEHVRIGLLPAREPMKKIGVEIVDLGSTNGTVVRRGVKEKEDNEGLITEIPEFPKSSEVLKAEQNRTDAEQAIESITVELEDDRFNPVKSLLEEKAGHKRDQEAWQKLEYGIDAQASEQLVGQVERKLKREYPKLYEDYKSLKRRLHELHEELRE